MPMPVYMPQLSPTMTEGRLARWLKAEGDAISAGDVIAEVETDKATMEVEATDDGIIHQIIGAAGDDIVVGAPIAVLRADGENVPADYTPVSQVAQDVAQGKEQMTQDSAVEATPAAVAVPAALVTSAPLPAPKMNVDVVVSRSSAERQPSATEGWVKASPLAKRLAGQKGVSLQGVAGSGPYGRVIARDVADLQSAPGATGALEVFRQQDRLEKLTPMRKAIAGRLTASKQQVPHFYVTRSVRMDDLLQMRKQLNAHYVGQAGQVKLTVNDFIVKACALALADYPAANAAWNSDSIVYFGNVDIAVAVAIPGGLITPILFNANQKSISALSQEMKILAQDAKAGALKPEQYEGGGFSVSNLGMYGVDHFQAIVNPPQAAILACGGTTEQVLAVNGAMQIAHVMTISLSVDHRVIDGALAAELIGRIVYYLETPAVLIS